jgi:hypothetical protein
MLQSIKNRIPETESIIIVQAEKRNLMDTLNLICTARRVGIPKEQIQVWSLDKETHSTILKQHIHSYYSVNGNGTSKSRAEFWAVVNEQLPFWWMDSNVAFGKDIRQLGPSGDITFQDNGSDSIKDIVTGVKNHAVDRVQVSTGFFHVKSNERTKRLFHRVKELIEQSDLDDQQILSRAIKDTSKSSTIKAEYFSVDDIWSSHRMTLKWAKDPFVVHTTGLDSDQKILLLSIMRKWHLYESGSCKYWNNKF